MDPVLQGLVVVLFFSALNEALIEYLFGNTKGLHAYLPLITSLFAIFLTFSYSVNLFSLFLGIQSDAPFLDILFSGLLVSRLSNFINDLAQKFLGSK